MKGLSVTWGSYNVGALQTKHLKHETANQCLTSDGQQLMLKACDPNSDRQMWILENYREDVNAL